MINKLELRNFQSHDFSTLEFNDGVNVIIGPSDSGKTAIFRAFRWLMYNRPLGDSYRSHWGGDTQVKITLKNGTVIDRWRTDEAHGYKMNGELYTGLRSEVPEEIQNALQMTSINFQQQFDRPFLIDESPGNVAAHFNAISHLESIDKALRNLNRGERACRNLINQGKEQIRETEKELEKYKILDEIDKALTQAQDMEEISAMKNYTRLSIRTLALEVESTYWKEAELSNILEMDTVVRKASSLIQKRNETKKQHEDLLSKIRQLNNWNKADRSLHKLRQLEEWVVKAEAYILKKDALQLRINNIESHLCTIQKEERELNKARKQVQLAENEFQRKLPDICPLCGSVKGEEQK